MKRKTVGMCTALWLAMAGCSPDGEATDVDPTSAGESTALAQQVQSVTRKVHGPAKGTFDGTPFTAVVEVTGFSAKDTVVLATAKLTQITGELSDPQRAALRDRLLEIPVVVGPAVRPQAVVQAPDGGVGALGAVCDVLFLRLQPLNLDLLGLKLNLDTVTLDVDAEPGAGNLIGNLLCSVAGLLDPAGTLGGLTPTNIAQAVQLLNSLVSQSDGGVPPLPVPDGSVMSG